MAIATVMIAVLFNEDFDGPPAYEARWEWLFWSSLVGCMLLYCSVEAIGWRTIGKQMFGLLVVSREEGQRGRYWRRFFVKGAPLAALASLFLSAVLYNRFVAWPGAWEDAWIAGREVPVAFLFASLVSFGSFAACWTRRRQAFYDWLSGTIVVRSAYPAAPRSHGFPVIATSLERAESAGYSPTAAHE
jgi:hypothetical protein